MFRGQTDNTLQSLSRFSPQAPQPSNFQYHFTNPLTYFFSPHLPICPQLRKPRSRASSIADRIVKSPRKNAGTIGQEDITITLLYHSPSALWPRSFLSKTHFSIRRLMSSTHKHLSHYIRILPNKREACKLIAPSPHP